MNPQQNKTLNYLLTATGMAAQKANLVHGATGGRSESRADLTDAEAGLLIAHLQTLPQKQNPKQEAALKMRRKLIAMAREMGYYKADPNNRKRFVADMPAINGWCIKYGYGHKPLSDYTLAELPKLLSQFETVLNKYLKKV